MVQIDTPWNRTIAPSFHKAIHNDEEWPLDDRLRRAGQRDWSESSPLNALAFVVRFFKQAFELRILPFIACCLLPNFVVSEKRNAVEKQLQLVLTDYTKAEYQYAVSTLEKLWGSPLSIDLHKLQMDRLTYGCVVFELTPLLAEALGYQTE